MSTENPFANNIEDAPEEEESYPLHSPDYPIKHTSSYSRFLSPRFPKRSRACFLLFLGVVFTLFITIAVISAVTKTVFSALGWQSSQKRNLILFISDGMGPASVTLAREAFLNNETTVLDAILTGAIRTRSYSSYVTDSAASATAYATYHKTQNKHVGVDASSLPVGTLFEAAKKAGYLVGVVATSRITHATPASFTAHVLHRDYEGDIAEQQIGAAKTGLGRIIDVGFAGGRCFFLPKGNKESCREDDKDFWGDATRGAYGWKTLLTTRKEMEAVVDGVTHRGQEAMPVLGLFTPDHMAYEVDRLRQRVEKQEPSLKEMAMSAISLLTHASLSNKGFVLLVEGSRIDMTSHSNDIIAHGRGVLAYLEAIEAVTTWAKQDGNTVVISTSDHETGGLTLGRQTNVEKKSPDYLWNPNVIVRGNASLEMVLRRIMYKQKKQPDVDASQVVEDVVGEYLGIHDLTAVEKWIIGDISEKEWRRLSRLSESVSTRASIGWTSRGHTGVDVNLYAMGKESEAFHGNMENTELGKRMSEWLSVGPEMEAMTMWWKDRVATLAMKEAAPTKKPHRFHYVIDLDEDQVFE